jgi:peptidoglycan-associated lipoprotein
MMSGLVAKYAFAGCLCASVVDLIVVDFVVGPRALRPEPAMPLVSEPQWHPEPATTPTPTATATATVDPDPARARRSRTHVVARFESDQPTARDNDLAALAAAMVADPTAEIVLEGHTDQRGDPARNRTLSMERATWAKNQLVALGVSASRIAVVGLGAERPLENGGDDAAVASNRRVEFRWLSGAASREER